ncbi:hypothetical protein LQW54_012318 [Pestalotiopsis sp. IQ-011]
MVSPDCLDPAPASGVTAMGTIDHEGGILEVVEESEHFYGSSSAASFMRQAVETANGPSYSPHRGNASAESVSARQGQKQTTEGQGFMSRAYSENFSLAPRSLADHLLSRFWDKVYYLYPVFHRPAFDCAYRDLWEAPTDENNSDSTPNVGLGSPPSGGTHTMLFHCALNIMFAIGVSFSDIPSAEKEAAAAKTFIGLDLLDINNIGLLQVMLLVTVFLQSTPFPSRCWHAIGIACRVAQGLGLHTSKPRRGEGQLEIEISRRVWQGCVIPDMLCHLLKDILGQVYQGDNFGQLSEPTPPGKYAEDFTAILQLERRLLMYQESLPPILSWLRP